MKSSSSMRPLTTGTALSASTHALTKNDIRPSLIPFFFVNSSCLFRRNSCTALMSHSLNVVRIAAVCCAITSCCAILRRNGDIFFRMNRPSPDGSTSIGDGAAALLTASPTGLVLPRPSTAANTSALVRRPSWPVPEIFAGASLSSSTRRRTAGERGFSFSGGAFSLCSTVFSAASGCFSFSSGAFFFSGGFSAFFSSGTFFSSGRCFESSIVATTSPIFTSWPSGTLVSSTPALSATISVETLSVSSVKRISPSFTNSPDFLCQTETTPLVMDSPTAGIFTSMAMRENYAAPAGLIERRGRDVFRQPVQLDRLSPNCQAQACYLLIEPAAQNDCAARSCYGRAGTRKAQGNRCARVKDRRKLCRTQGLGRQDDLPQSRGTNAFSQGGFGRVNKCIWIARLKRSAFCFIDKRAVRARDYKIDFALTKVAQNPIQNFHRFSTLREISAGMRAFDCERAVSCENDCACAFAQNHSKLLSAERLNWRRCTK